MAIHWKRNYVTKLFRRPQLLEVDLPRRGGEKKFMMGDPGSKPGSGTFFFVLKNGLKLSKKLVQYNQKPLKRV